MTAVNKLTQPFHRSCAGYSWPKPTFMQTEIHWTSANPAQHWFLSACSQYLASCIKIRSLTWKMKWNGMQNPCAYLKTNILYNVHMQCICVHMYTHLLHTHICILHFKKPIKLNHEHSYRLLFYLKSLNFWVEDLSDQIFKQL